MLNKRVTLFLDFDSGKIVGKNPEEKDKEAEMALRSNFKGEKKKSSPAREEHLVYRTRTFEREKVQINL